MEFKLPFPTLQEVAVLEIAHSLMDLRVNDQTMVLNRENYLRESFKKVDKLLLPEKQKCHIREVLEGTSDHLLKWYVSRRLSICRPICVRGKLQFDIFGCVDEVRMARDLLKKSDERHDTDLLTLKHLLCVASYYVFLPDIQKILPKFLKLLAADSITPQLKGPEFEIERDGKLCLVYKFVDKQGTPMSLNVNYRDDFFFYPAVRVTNSCVRIVLRLCLYDSKLFQLHWNLLKPSKRISFFGNLMVDNATENFVYQVVDILNYLDPDSRHCILGGMHCFDTLDILRCFLVWPYQQLFVPVFQLVRSSSKGINYELLDVFKIIVPKLDMMAFEKMLLLFWEAISSVVKFYHRSNTIYARSFSESFNNVLRGLSCKNALLYKRVATDLNLPLTYLQEP